jgi:hypothetical protein
MIKKVMTMQTLHLTKTIENTNLEELEEFIGKKVEITIEPITEETLEEKKAKIFEIIERCAGHVEPWTRDEIHER